MDIFVPPPYIHIHTISSTVIIVVVTIVTITIITVTTVIVYSSNNNIWPLLSAHYVQSTVLTISVS